MTHRVETSQDKADRLHRRNEAFACNAIEGQPASEATIEMFEMFDREGMSFDERRDYIVARAEASEATFAAE